MKKRDIPNMMYMAVMPILIYQNDCIRMSLVIETLPIPLDPDRAPPGLHLSDCLYFWEQNLQIQW